MDQEVKLKDSIEREDEFKESIESITCNGKYKLWITDPQTPQDEFMNDIYISFQQMKAGDVYDSDKSLKAIREELGLDAD